VLSDGPLLRDGTAVDESHRTAAKNNSTTVVDDNPTTAANNDSTTATDQPHHDHEWQRDRRTARL
jgi:hypothetical protein